MLTFSINETIDLPLAMMCFDTNVVATEFEMLVSNLVLQGRIPNNIRRTSYSAILPIKRNIAPKEVIKEEGAIDVIGLKKRSSQGKTVNTSQIENDEIKEEIRKKLSILYLQNPTEFLKLNLVFNAEENSRISKSKRVVDENIKSNVLQLHLKYGKLVLDVLYDILKEKGQEEKIYKVHLRTMADEVLSTFISLLPFIELSDGRLLGIDNTTYLMEGGIDIDYVKWKPVKDIRGIIRLDISDVVNYMYQKTHKRQGLNTAHIEWCNGEYVIIGMDGSRYFCDTEGVTKRTRIELLKMCLVNKLGTVIGVTTDSIYLKGTTKLKNYTCLQLQLYNGVCLDMPIQQERGF